jgi:hypothetical protein
LSVVDQEAAADADPFLRLDVAAAVHEEVVAAVVEA